MATLMDGEQIEQLTEYCKEILASSLFLSKKQPIAVLAADIGVSEKSLRSLLDNGTVSSAKDAAKFLIFLNKQEKIRAGNFERVTGF